MDSKKRKKNTQLSRRLGARSLKRDNTRKARIVVHCCFNPYFVPAFRKFAHNRGFSYARMAEIACVLLMEKMDKKAVESVKANAPEIFANINVENFGGVIA